MEASVSKETEAPTSAVAPEVVGDSGQLPFPLVQSLPSLLRKSLKRTLDLFIGNRGVCVDKLWPLKTPREKRIRVLLNEEFNVSEPGDSAVVSDKTFKQLGKLEKPPSSLALQLAQAAGRPQSKTSTALQRLEAVGPSPAASRDLVLSKSSDGLSGSRSSDVLQHLVFRRPLRIPKATQHPKWELMRVISGHQGWVRALSVDPTNEWFASGGNDRLIKIWDLASGTLKLSLTGHINTIRALEVSHRHPYLFSAGEDQMVKCWDLEYNKVIRHYHGHLSGIYSMTLHPSLDILATGGRDAVVRVWDMRTKLAVHVLSGHTGTVMSLASQKAEPQFISGSLDKMIRCWDLVSGRSSVVLTHHKKAIRGLAIHPREYTFCSAAADHLKIWKCPKGDFERNLEAVGSIINAVTIRDDPTSSIVIAGSDQGHLHFWDWASGQKFQTIETIPQPGSLSGEKAIYAVQLDMSETRLFTAECDKTIKVWREVSDSASSLQ